MAASVFLLGDPRLYAVSSAVAEAESADLPNVLLELRGALLAFRRRRGTGKAIAAPQIGIMKRIIYLYEPGPPRLIVNPLLTLSGEQVEPWESCMSFPDLLVRTRRARFCSIRYRDVDWRERSESAQDELATVLQHEHDHLDGILAVARAADAHSFCLSSQLANISSGKSARLTVLPFHSGR